MPYTTVVAGTTITASWGNANVRDQVVTPFASTGARDSAITAPVAGMVCAITSNDSAEGILMRTSASTWRPPWNLPWGVVGYGAATSNQTGISAIADLTSCTVTFTAVGNRRYRVIGQASLLQVTTNGSQTLALTDGSNVVQQQLVDDVNYITSAGVTKLRTLAAVVVPGAGAVTYKLRASTGAGTATASASAASPNFVLVEDIGPSGAPA